MRYMNGLAAAFLALIIGGAWMHSAAQAPGGSYRETCRDVEVRGSTLYANCKDANNGWQRTELRDYDRCGGEIQNLNGSLQCTGDNRGGNRGRGDGRPGGFGWRQGDRGYNGAPRGSYVETCQDIHTDGNTLMARCQKKNGGWRDSTLKHYDHCGTIENDNGRLSCR